MSKTYLVEELFEDIPGDSENVIFKIPDEICKEMNWQEGTKLEITSENGSLVLKEVK